MDPVHLCARDICLHCLSKSEVYCRWLDHIDQECPQCHFFRVQGNRKCNVSRLLMYCTGHIFYHDVVCVSVVQFLLGCNGSLSKDVYLTVITENMDLRRQGGLGVKDMFSLLCRTRCFRVQGNRKCNVSRLLMYCTGHIFYHDVVCVSVVQFLLGCNGSLSKDVYLTVITENMDLRRQGGVWGSKTCSAYLQNSLLWNIKFQLRS